MNNPSRQSMYGKYRENVKEQIKDEKKHLNKKC